MTTAPDDSSPIGPAIDDDIVYIVEDDLDVRLSLHALLTSADFRVAAFESGAAFLQYVTPSMRGCIILDLRLPDMSGLEVQASLAALRNRLPVIAITAFADVSLAVDVMKAGAFDFLEKPYSDDSLVERVRLAFESQNPLPVTNPAADSGVAARVELLTAREREVMERVVAGKQSKQIAYELRISPRTVEIHRARMMLKLEARNLAHLVRMVLYGNTPADGR